MKANYQHMLEAAHLLRGHFAHWSRWTDGQIMAWLHFFGFSGFLCLASDDAGKVIGVGMARLLTEPQYRHLRFMTQPEGKIIWIDALVAPTPGMMLWMLRQVREHYPQATQIGFARYKAKRRYSLYDIDVLTERICHAFK